MPSEPAPGLLQRKSLWVALLLFSASGGAGWWWLTHEQTVADLLAGGATAVSSDRATPSATTDAPTTTPIVAPVAPVGDVTLESKGYIIPAHQILVSPKVNGMIVSLRFEEGMRVQKGDVLAELESVDYTADVARAKAVLASAKHHLLELEQGNRPEEIAAAKAELAEAEAQRDQLYADWKRNIGLRANKTVTERDYEQSESSYKAMDRRAAKLSNNLKLMKDGPRVERIDVAQCRSSTGRSRSGQGRLAIGQLHDRGTDFRHDPQEER